MPQDMKEWRHKARERLIEQLGGQCVDCKKTKEEVKLEFSHVIPLSDEQSEYRSRIGANKRMVLYRKEAREGLIALRCHRCNTKMSGSEPKQGFFTFSEVPIENIPF